VWAHTTLERPRELIHVSHRCGCEMDICARHMPTFARTRAHAPPSSLTARVQLRGVAYYRLGEHELAMTHWRSGLKFDPEHAGCKDMYRLLKKLTKKTDAADAALAEGRVADAIAGWRDAIAIDPGHYAFMGPLLVKVRWRALSSATELNHAPDRRADLERPSQRRGVGCGGRFRNGGFEHGRILGRCRDRAGQRAPRR
jgi:tetratricopeptide (TPR) repeat protein